MTDAARALSGDGRSGVTFPVKLEDVHQVDLLAIAEDIVPRRTRPIRARPNAVPAAATPV